MHIHTHPYMEKVQLMDGHIYVFKNRGIFHGSHSFNAIHFMSYRTFYISGKMKKTKLKLLRSICS